MRRAGWLLSIVAACAASGCTYAKEENVVTSVTGAIDARIVRVTSKIFGITAKGSGHFGVPVPARLSETKCALWVTKPKPLGFAIDGACEEQRLESDPGGMRLAWGSRGTYRYIYFGSKGRSFDGPEPLTEPIVWERVPTLAQALPALFRKMIEREHAELHSLSSKKPPPTFGDGVLDEIFDAQGSSAAVKALIATLDAPFSFPRGGYVGLWRRAFLRLDEPARNTVRAELLSTIKRAKAGPDALGRALLHVDLSGV